MSNLLMWRRIRVAYPLIISLALLLRLVNLGGRTLWYDEAFAVLFAEKGFSAMLHGTLTPVAGGAADIHPLLYYSTLNIWMSLVGQSSAQVRLWSVLLGLLTVLVVMLLTHELFGGPTDLVAGVITAVSPFQVQYSQEARMYALLGLLLMLAVWCFLRAWRVSDRQHAHGWRLWRWWLGFAVCASLAMYAQQLAAFFLAALGLIPLLARRPDQFRRMLISSVLAILFYLPWLVNLPAQFAKVRSYYWLDPPSIGRPLLTIRSFLSVNLDIPAPASMIAFILALIMVLFLSVQVIMVLRRQGQANRQPLLWVLWLAAAPLVLMWLVSQVQPVYLERSLLPSALMLGVAFAWLFTRAGLPRPIAMLISGFGIVLVAIGLYYHYTWSTFPNSPFDAAMSAIRANWEPGDAVVHQNKLTALPSVYYARDLDQRYVGDTPGSGEDSLALPTQETLGLLANACASEAVRAASRVWWVAFSMAEAQYHQQDRPEYARDWDWLTDHYTVLERRTFNDLDVVLMADPHGDLTPECPQS